MHRAIWSGPALALALAGVSPAFAADSKDSKEPPKDAAAAPAPAPELPERFIEKKDGEFDVKLLVRPGNLKVHRTADVSADLEKVLEIPDPVTGDRAPIAGHPYVVVQPPTPPAPETKGKHAATPATPAPLTFALIAKGEAGQFGFHFTPEYDGVYELTFHATDPRPPDGEEARSYAMTFRIGAGTAASQTEVSQGAAAGRRGARRPVGGEATSAKDDELQKLMTEIGNRYLDLGPALREWPAKGANGDAAAEAKAIAGLFGQVKGHAPHGTEAASSEFDKLADGMAQKFEELANSANTAPKDRAKAVNAAVASYDKLSPVGCTECHAKFRWGVTNDLSQWPDFTQKPWKK